MTQPAASTSAIYTGHVAHRRLRPRTHAFRYRAYWLLLDLDDVPSLSQRLRLFSHNRWNVFSFHEADHGHVEKSNLREHLDAELRQAGVELGGGAIRILCMPRVLGFVFNPLSVHFCYDAEGDLRALVYEVHNTFHERHSYLIAMPRSADQVSHPAIVDQACAKRFYVSPFMTMAMNYRFKVRPPADDISVVICGDDADGPLIVASLAGTKRPLTDAMLLRQFLTLPLITIKVVAAIHWEALRLWLKGIRLVPRPAPPANAVTIVRGREISVGE